MLGCAGTGCGSDDSDGGAGAGAAGAGAGGTGGHGSGAGGSGTGAAGGGGAAGGAVPDIPVGHCGAQPGRYFPASSWIYTDVTDAPARPDSPAMTSWLEAHGGWGNGDRFQLDTSFVILDADESTPRVARTANDPLPYGSPDCDPDVQVPIPEGGRIEGFSDYTCPGRISGSPEADCHLIVAELSERVLYEGYQATYTNGELYISCTIAWDMTADVWGAPPEPGSALPAVPERNWGIGRDCSGPDAAGFPIAPLLFTIGDVLSGRVEHAIRFALPNDRLQWAPTTEAEGPIYVWPATHAGGPDAIDPAAPIYGTRWRLRPDFDPEAAGLDPNNPVVQAVLYGLQHYGMLMADGGEIALMAEDASDCGTHWEDLWGEQGSRVLDGIRPTDFDVLDSGGTDGGWDCQRNPARP